MAAKTTNRRISSLVLAGFGAVMSLPGCAAIDTWTHDVETSFQEESTVHTAREPKFGAVEYRHDVSFPPSVTAMSTAAGQDLRLFLDRVGAGDATRVSLVEPAAPSALSSRRREAVAVAVAMSGVRVAPTPAALPEASQATPLGDDQIAVVVERYALQLPACPDWTERPNQNFDNQPGSFWSCATAINLGMMVADPGDLVRGRSIGDADGTTMARSVQRYRLGQTKDLIRDAASAEIFPSPAPAPESKSSISTTGK